MFDYTSKLSLADIKKEVKAKEENKIKSPYTIERKNERIFKYVALFSIVVLLFIICYLLYTILTDKEEVTDDIVYGGVIYESTK